MSEYLSISFGSSTAVPKAVEYDKAMIVGDGSPSSLSESKVYELSPSNWNTQLAEDGFALGDTLYDSVSVFFSASPSPQRLWAYAHISGAQQEYEDVSLNFVGEETWEVPLKPPTRFLNNLERVKFYCCEGGTGYTYNYADGSQGCPFEIEEDGAGNWNGRLTFSDGLSGASCGIVDPVTYNCKITCDYVIGTQGDIGQALEDYGINMVSLALDNNSSIKNYVDSLFGSQLSDIMTMSSAIAGKNCVWFYALPGGADPEDTITGTASKWKELKQLIGARQDVAVIKVIPSALNHDPASGYMAMTVISHPHQQMTFAEPHFGILKQEPVINRNKWSTAQIACIMKRTELSGDPFLVTFGFTFGSGDVSRIEGTRCRFVIAQKLINAIWGLLAKRTTLMSYDGMETLESTVRGVFEELISMKICDKLSRVYIPIKEDLLKNTAAGILARQQQKVPAMEIDYEWYTSLEKIRITRVQNVAT